MRNAAINRKLDVLKIINGPFGRTEMTKAFEKIKGSLEQALDHAKGNPREGTRERWFDHSKNKLVGRVFKDGKWVEE